MRFGDRATADLLKVSSYFPCKNLVSALNDSKIGIVVCDRRFRYKALNQSVAEMHNVPIKGHLNRSFEDVLGNFADKVLPLWETVFATGLPSTNLEVAGKLPKRQDAGTWIENLFPLRDARGRLTQVGCIVIETTRHRRHGSTLAPPGLRANEGTDPRLAGPGQHHGVPLSHREEEVLRLLAEGKSNKQISSTLAISTRTVETYRARLMLKLQATSVVHLVQYAIRNRIIAIEDE